MQLYTLHAIKYGSTVLAGITRVDTSLNEDWRGEPTDGSPYPSVLSLYQRRPQARWSTKHIGQHLDVCGVSGLAISGLSGGFKLFGQPIAAEGIRSTTGFYSLTYRAGIVAPDSISCNHNSDAEISYALHAQYSETNGNGNAIVAVSAAESLPTIADDAERYGLGPVAIGSVDLVDIRSLQVAIGLDIQAEAADGDTEPAQVYIASWNTRITLRGVKVTSFGDSAIPLVGKEGTHDNTTIYLRRRKHGTEYEADDQSKHLKITADGVAYVDNPFAATGNAPGECSIVMSCRHDGSNLPIIITTDQAIT